mmetsp:Transcript_20920/g.58164  ORF Transcript_20920/g.58164 Transcript_20920/m.58164 type:complete len:501 (+) Transcript_20920:178-1680(+)|eukprot:CAMPEP_0172367650 /NCGR_PEP_ID=MMETSP1060-20121228/22868_1 /TAXON_ID=37318 /ORGANISM="Pseudo-nitzschia pungens, Strain cf. cingulata" /LENGTH=500 /DNA_ID=CAMNT_0013091981 /DNA_START=165 /DNA_END=1667 /DNA_ORIENTATION=-
MASLLLQPPKIPPQEAEVSEDRWESHPYASLYDQVLSSHPDAVVSNAMTPNANSNSKTGPAIPAMITSMGFPSPNIISLPMHDSDDSPAVVPPSSSASSTSETDSSYDDDDDVEEEEEEDDGEDDDVVALLRNGNLDIHHLELDEDDDKDKDDDDDDAISVHTIDSMETIDFVPSCAKSSELHVVGSSYPSSEDPSTSIYPKKRARPNESLATSVSAINTTTTTSRPSQPKKTPSSFDAALLPPMKKFKAVSSSRVPKNLNLHGSHEKKLMMEARQHQLKQMMASLERRKCMFASMRLRLEQEEMQTNLQQKQFFLCLLRQENQRLLEMKKAMKGEEKPKKGSVDATRSSSSSLSSSSDARKSSKNDAKWMMMLEKLKVYKKQHGNTLVPVRYKDRQLGEWVRQQRRRCKRPERTKMLEDMGFAFIVRPNRGHWFDMYQKLVDYKKTHNGSTNVPMGDKDYSELAEWVGRQRMLYRNWGISRHRKDLLERIGFKLKDNNA